MRSSIAIVIALGLLLALATPALADGATLTEDFGSAYGSAGVTISFSAAVAQYGFGDLAGGYAWGFEALADNVALAQFHCLASGQWQLIPGAQGLPQVLRH